MKWNACGAQFYIEVHWDVAQLWLPATSAQSWISVLSSCCSKVQNQSLYSCLWVSDRSGMFWGQAKTFDRDVALTWCPWSTSWSSLAWPDPIPHRGKRSGTWTQSNLSPWNLHVSSHVNPVMTTHGNRLRLASFLHPWFWFYCAPAHDSRHFSLSVLLTLQVHALLKPKFWIFLVITYFRCHVTEYCAVIGMHSMVRGDKLLYGHVPDPFPRVWPRKTLAEAAKLSVAECTTLLYR